MDDAGFAVIVRTHYGPMIVNRNDINQTGTLITTGRSPEHREIVLLSRILQESAPGAVAVDVGANFGTFSLSFAAAVGSSGKVHAFEPQRIIFNMLCGTVALNSRENIFCYQIALGDKEGLVDVPSFDYRRPLNFGSIEFGPTQREQLSQDRGTSREKVRMAALDDFALSPVTLIKIDAEGMDDAVVRGAWSTIKRARPVLFIETLKIDKRDLRLAMAAAEYDIVDAGPNDLYIPREKRDILNALRVPPARKLNK